MSVLVLGEETGYVVIGVHGEWEHLVVGPQHDLRAFRCFSNEAKEIRVRRNATDHRPHFIIRVEEAMDDVTGYQEDDDYHPAADPTASF